MYTVITKGNEVHQYVSFDSVERSVNGPFLAIDSSNGSKVAFTATNPINWPADASDGLQAIVDVKAGTLRFGHDEMIGLTEFVVSNYIEDSPPVHIFDLIKEWPTDETRPAVLVSHPGFSWRHHDEGDWSICGMNGDSEFFEGDWLNHKFGDCKPAKSFGAVEDCDLSTHVTAASILTAALGHMEDRAKTYDAPGGERSMGKTVAAFNVITGHTLTEEAGWLFMEILKQVRSQQGDYRADNYEDMVAYAALRGECAARERGNQ